MANRYGEAALLAAQHGSGGNISPADCWESAMEKLYPTSMTARKKRCPRGTFLGLCEEGLVKGIPAGRYAASKEDRAYAVRAVALLTEETQHWSTSALWRAVTDGAEKAHKNQMDIVLALWNNNLIVVKS
jgi:hypothetical protein